MWIWTARFHRPSIGRLRNCWPGYIILNLGKRTAASCPRRQTCPHSSDAPQNGRSPMQALNDSDMENWHDYEVESRREVISLLRSLGEKNQLIRMLIHGEADVCVTSILDVNAEGN